ncbi:hypothetical protein HPSA20_0261 [Helicobacter pylori SouthAfrica20]|uniref:Uncharacterized protein n=1 Tax=Helicobacter pylori SouthAfrica20 TaxID=1352356 RepID=T1UAN6_HELPX|nr:hypothetical protein HPSA20_0261 [Helicobacter pylori SouthAfrica20]
MKTKLSPSHQPRKKAQISLVLLYSHIISFYSALTFFNLFKILFYGKTLKGIGIFVTLPLTPN